MGSRGTTPLAIIAPLPDLCRHLSNCIARAEHEVFLATNFWANSDASTLVTNALRELSRRAGERGRKVVVKMMYDRGDPKSVVDNHLIVPEKVYTGEKTAIPSSEEIPHLDLQVMNYHTPVLGTFHSKFSVIDRRVGLIQSSNIQDNDNMEMLVHVEGPIVDSLYDTALISWGKAFDPPMPLMNSPAATAPIPYLERQNAAGAPHESDGKTLLPEHTTKDPHYDDDFEKEARRVNESLEPRHGQSKTQGVTRHLSKFMCDAPFLAGNQGVLT
jgi:phosphatidylserine/phosphatidylglycerophosphate/cardiolipin synthase-like enzyme